MSLPMLLESGGGPISAFNQGAHTEVALPPPAAPPSDASGDYDEHLLSISELSVKFGVQIDEAHPSSSLGLAASEASRRLEVDGPNALKPPPTDPDWLLYAKEWANPFIIMLCVAAVLGFIAYGLSSSDITNLVLGILLLFTCFVVTIMNFYNARQINDVMARIKTLLPSEATVIRGATQIRVPVAELVCGDLVFFTIGNAVPADVRVLASSQLRVEMSSLTGEPDAVACSPEARSQQPLEARNLLFNGTYVMAGSAHALVVKTGARTLIGKIAQLSSVQTVRVSTLQREVRAIVIFIVVLSAVMAIAIMAVGFARGRGVFVSLVQGGVLVLVANVPEGLPATVTTLLALAAKQMAASAVLVKRTDTIEQIGNTTVICSDKTGTLTANSMTVQRVYVQGELLDGSAGKLRRARPGAVDRAMGIGRQMSILRDNSLVVHSRTAQRHQLMIPHDATGVEPAPANDDAAIPSGGGGATDTLLQQPVSGIAVSGVGGLEPTNQEGRESFMSFQQMTNVYWSRANAFTRLLIVAAVCNRAVFAAVEEAVAAGAVAPEEGGGATPADEGGTSGGVTGEVEAEEEGGPSTTTAVSPSPLRLRISSPSARSAIARPPPPQLHRSPRTDEAAGAAAPHPQATVRVLGDASDAALLRYAQSFVPVSAVRRAFPTLAEIPFSSVTKVAIVMTSPARLGLTSSTVEPRRSTPSHYLILLKGAPECVLARCSSHYCAGAAEAPLDASFNLGFQAAHERCAFSGERVLGFAYKVVSHADAVDGSTNASAAAAPTAAVASERESTPRPTLDIAVDSVAGLRYLEGPGAAHGFCFAGLISMADPPREGVAAAVAKCRSASIKVAMITGDHPITAEAIARQTGIITGETAREVAARLHVDVSTIHAGHPEVDAVIISGFNLHGLSPAAWDLLLAHKEIVFARTAPEQKLEIVENYQRLGHIVAMTGDGTNDAPALRKAHIGVAMGSKNASDVAREAADLILLNDDFASIVKAIEVGRTLADNLRKTVAYTLTHGLPEVLPIMILVLFDTPFALTGLLILVVDLISEQGPAISLSYEEPEDNIMARPPRDLKRDRIISWALVRYSYLIAGLLEGIICLSNFFLVIASLGVPGWSVLYSAPPYWEASSPDLIVHGEAFSAHQQVVILEAGVGAFFWALVACQVQHIWLVKTRRSSACGPSLCNNRIMIVGCAVALLVAGCFINVPAVNSFVGTTFIPVWAYFLPSIFGIIMLPYTECVKFYARTYPHSCIARELAW